MTTILGMLGALQGLILAAAVTSLGGPGRKPNRVLGAILFTLSVTVFTVTGEHGGLFGTSIYPVLLEYTLALLFPPLLWHYARTILGQSRLSSVWPHCIPVVLWVSYILAFRAGLITWRWLPPILGLVVYLMAYTIVLAKQVWTGGDRSTSLVSHRAVMKALLVSLAISHAAQLVRYLFRDVAWLTDIVPLTATGAFSVVSVLALRRSRVFAGREQSASTKKYRSSNLTSERAEEVERQLKTILERDRPFLNENLNLADMAARLKVSRSHLSQVVNDRLDCTFSELLARYRVREAEKVLVDPKRQHLTIEAIGYEVGFRSRSGFHSAFKRQQGETPAQARKRMSQKIIEDT